MFFGGIYNASSGCCIVTRNSHENISHIHLRHLNPFPANLGDCILNFNKILIPELNMGHLKSIIRDKYLVDAKGFNQIAGKPFSSNEVFQKIKLVLKEE